jgi:membrane protease YdiL (CAAX protease family)
MEADPQADAGTSSFPELLQPSDPAAAAPPRRGWPRALFEVVLTSGFPTQMVILLGLALAGFKMGAGDLTLGTVATVILVDSAVLVGLIWLLLQAGGERPLATLFGSRPVARELAIGLFVLLPAAFAIVVATAVPIVRYAPWLQLEQNPLAGLVDSRLDMAVLALLGIVGGGIREEVQRAFILHRFEQHLGGAYVGLVCFSLMFGLGHLLQGWAAVIMTGLLGAFWGLVYIARRSIAGPVASHAVFNVLQTVFGLRP